MHTGKESGKINFFFLSVNKFEIFNKIRYNTKSKKSKKEKRNVSYEWCYDTIWKKSII